MENRRLITDMAVEFCKTTEKSNDGIIKYYEVEVDKKLSAKLDRPCGRYSTFETTVVLDGNTDDFSRLSDAITRALRSYLDGCGRIMCIGLGNPDLTADALGDRVFKKLNVTRHISSDGEYLCALTPNVFGMTGIESFDIIAAVVNRIKPEAVIAVDSLTAAATERIACAFQITDSGITPGSGVDNHRRRLDRQSLGVRVVSVGVPLVVYSSTIAREACGGKTRGADMIVTPKDIDVLVEDCSTVIADGINGLFEGRHRF